MEMKEDFGKLVRRIMYSNSGQFRALGAKPPEAEESKTWTRYKDLAAAAAARCNYAQAESMWLHALEEAQNFPPGDRRQLFTLENVASLYMSLHRFEQAEMFCSKALDIALNVFGSSDVRTANYMNHMAGIYYSQRRYRDAEPLCIKLLYIYESTYGPDHPDVGMALNNLGMLYHVERKYKQAARMYMRALRIRARALGKDHEVVKTLVQNYCNLMRETNQVHVASELEREFGIEPAELLRAV